MAKSTQDVLADLAAIRERVAERYPTASAAPDGDAPANESTPLADLMPLFEARDAAEGKIASVGKVNPRAGGALNAVIQLGKRSIARGLGWFIREQVDFNAAAVRAMTETLEALNEINRGLAVISARQTKLQRAMLGTEALRTETDAHLRQATDALSGQIRAVSSRFDETAGEMERSLRADLERMQSNLEERSGALDADLQRLREEAHRRAHEREKEDIRLLRTLADIQNAAQQQWGLLERELRQAVEQRGALAEERSSVKAAEAADSAIGRMEALVHRELRLLRQRVGGILESGGAIAQPELAATTAALAIAGETRGADSLAFSDRFRGTEDDVKRKLRIYLPRLDGCSPIADLGCGRGEFLDLFREAGGEGIGVEADPELAAIVARKGHRSYSGDLFAFLAEQAPESLGGIVCAHVIEHMPVEALVRLVREAYRVLRPGGMVIFETPNPACLAIFATYFYLDPTHVRPVPSELARYLLEEAGFTKIEVLGLRPAEEEFPELKPLPESFRQQFFGFLDYGILAQKS
ncbi:MAG: methyltransferase domain-containing protein [Bryobacterales bacterium]|nr:methyltransferase domain-containing protein [Bryobacterales bacterium]